MVKAQFVRVAITIGTISGAPLPAHAAESAADPVFLSLLFLFFLLAFGMVGAMIYERRKMRAKLHEAEYYTDILDGLLGDSREGYILFHEHLPPRFSPKLAHWLKLDRLPVEFKDLGVVYEDLRKPVERLLEKGKGFDIELSLDDPARQFRIVGTPLGGPGAGVVRFSDRSLDAKISGYQDEKILNALSKAKRARDSADLIDFPLWVRGEDSELVWVNRAYVTAVDGKNRASVIRKGQELVSGKFGRRLTKMPRSGTDAATEERHFVVIQGERRAVNIHTAPCQLEDGSLGCLAYALDVTELESAKDELVHHTESHSETLNKLSTAVAIFGSDKKLEYYNSAYAKLWGLSEGMLFGHPHYGEVLEAARENRHLPEQANFPEWKKQQLDAFTALLEPVEEMWHLPTGATLRVVTQPHPLGGLLFFYEDVTDYLALERSYNTLFAVQEETLNNLHEGVAVFGSDGCLKLFNHAYGEIWKLSEEFLGTSPHIVEVMEACERLFSQSTEREALQALVVEGEAKKEVSSGQLHRMDSSVINYSSVPLPDGAILMTYIDMTDGFRIETALRERNMALEETHKIKTDFLAHMSYELRNPLNSIIGFSELMEKEYQGPLNTAQREYMDNILQASGHLMELINDILDLTVVEAGGMTLEITEFDLPSVLAQVVSSLEDRTRQKELEVTIDCPKGLKTIMGDERRIQHSLYNLLSNAVKFTPVLGRITIGATQDELHYNLYVKDSGVGIEPGELDTVFEKFFTGSNIPKGQGAGLGLSLVKSFIELHGGTIRVDSVINGGTTITCALPKQMGLDAQIDLSDE